MVHERVQAVGPHLGRDDPVAEPSPVGAAVAEPAVIEHESLDADRRGLIGEGDELGGVVAEVDGLPHVQGHWSLRRAIDAESAKVVVESVRDRVEPVTVRSVDPRTLIRLVAREDDLAGQQHLTAAEHLLARVDPLGVVAVVAAPRGVHGPDPALGEPEPGHSRVQHVRAVGGRPAPTVLAKMDAGAQRAALRKALVVVLAREVQDLARFCGDREHERHLVDGVVGILLVRQRGPRADQAAGQKLQFEPKRQLCAIIRGVEDRATRARCDHTLDRGVVELDRGRDETRRPAATGCRSRESGPACPAGVVLGQKGDPGRGVDVVRADDRHGGVAESDERLVAEISELRTPVHDRGQASRGARRRRARRRRARDGG